VYGFIFSFLFLPAMNHSLLVDRALVDQTGAADRMASAMAIALAGRPRAQASGVVV